MKKLSQNSTRVIGILLIIAAPLFLNNNWKRAAKPTFKERVLAEVEAGKKVAVFTHLSKIVYESDSKSENELCQLGKGVIKKAPGSQISYQYIGWFDEYMPSEYDLSNIVAEQLNNGMSTDVFVPVAQDGLEKKTIHVLGIETEIPDWWNSDYDVIVEIILSARYVTTSPLRINKEVFKNGLKPYKTNLRVSPLMYVREVVEGKAALGYIVNGRNLGNSYSNTVDHSECYSSLDELKSNVAAIIDTELVETTQLGVTEPIAKFIEKENAKYDKAMKKKNKKKKS